MQIAEKTYADYTLTATNRGGHSSAPRPDNAIYANGRRAQGDPIAPLSTDDQRGDRADFERVAEGDKGQYGELIRKWLKDPADREAADLLEANDPGYTRTRCVASDAVGRPRAQRAAVDRGNERRIFTGLKSRRCASSFRRSRGRT